MERYIHGIRAVNP